MFIDAKDLTAEEINERLRSAQKPDGKMPEEDRIVHCLGHRFLAAGLSGRRVRIEGIPGNALGAYLNGAELDVDGNAQDAVGDTMNAGSIVIRGRVGDAAGYAMRGGRIFISGDAGYRAGIHMKAYQDRAPELVIGGCAGSFLGEYQAGGVIAVLGLGRKEKPLIGDYPCTGMHGGKLILRSDGKSIVFPDGVTAQPAAAEDKEEIGKIVSDFCNLFGFPFDEVMDSPFTVVRPDTDNPYRQLYVAN